MATTTKAAFIRSNSNLTPAQIVAKAKSAGIKLTLSHVYTQRYQDKLASGKNTRKPASASTKPAGSKLERDFLTLAADLGLARSNALLGKVRAAAEQAVV